VGNTYIHPYSEGPDKRNCFLLRICKESIHENFMDFWNARGSAPEQVAVEDDVPPPLPVAPPPPPPTLPASTKIWVNLNFTVNGGDQFFRLSGITDIAKTEGIFNGRD
jgi:hypothetical protein